MNDLISRQAAIDALGERPMVWTDDDQYTLGERNQYDRDRLAIETLPSAEKVGKWVEQPTDGRFGKQVECSECGEVYWAWMANFGYCPNCGADMRGEENDTD